MRTHFFLLPLIAYAVRLQIETEVKAELTTNDGLVYRLESDDNEPPKNGKKRTLENEDLGSDSVAVKTPAKPKNGFCGSCNFNNDDWSNSCWSKSGFPSIDFSKWPWNSCGGSYSPSTCKSSTKTSIF